MRLYIEATNWKYYAHLIGISAIVLGILQLWQGGDMFNLKNILISAGLIGVADLLMHQLFKLR